MLSLFCPKEGRQTDDPLCLPPAEAGQLLLKGARAHVSATMAGTRSVSSSDAFLAREAPRGAKLGMVALRRQGMRRCMGRAAAVYQGYDACDASILQSVIFKLLILLTYDTSDAMTLPFRLRRFSSSASVFQGKHRHGICFIFLSE